MNRIELAAKKKEAVRTLLESNPEMTGIDINKALKKSGLGELSSNTLYPFMKSLKNGKGVKQEAKAELKKAPVETAGVVMVPKDVHELLMECKRLGCVGSIEEAPIRAMIAALRAMHAHGFDKGSISSGGEVELHQPERNIKVDLS